MQIPLVLLFGQPPDLTNILVNGKTWFPLSVQSGGFFVLFFVFLEYLAVLTLNQESLRFIFFLTA